jgi:hypothetical protein
MSAPNLKNLTTVTADTTAFDCTSTTMADVVGAVATGHVKVLGAIYVTNYDTTIQAYVTVVHKKGGVEYEVACNRAVAVKTTVNLLLGKELYLAEGDSLRVKVGSSGQTVKLLVPWSDMTDL